MSLRGRLSHLRGTLNSGQGKNALIFLIFLGVSAGFWLLLTLNDEFQREIDVPVEITEIPDSVTILSTPPRTISASIKDKGSGLARFQFASIPTLRIRYRDFVRGDDRMVMGNNQIVGVLRSYFGTGAQILTVKPDSISLVYTTRPGVRLPIKVDISATADPRYVISGRPFVSTDSVTLYSIDDLPYEMTSLSTYPIKLANLSDTTRVTAKIKVPKGMRAIPGSISVTVPVEQLIAKRKMAHVEVINVPDGLSVVTFPSQVEVDYLIPMSAYNTDDYAIKVYADYNKISPQRSVTKVPLEMPLLPDIYHGTVIGTDSVEYVIEGL